MLHSHKTGTLFPWVSKRSNLPANHKGKIILLSFDLFSFVLFLSFTQLKEAIKFSGHSTTQPLPSPGIDLARETLIILFALGGREATVLQWEL